MNNDLTDVDFRLTRIESDVRAIRKQMSEAAPIARVPVEVKVSAKAPVHANAAAVESALPARKRAFDFEQFFGGRFLLGAGALAFLIGVTFFLKYAFDNGWVGPTGRVSMGLAGGVVFLILSERFWRAGQKYYAEALAGLGAGVLYLSLWAAGMYFHLLHVDVTFAAMMVVTAAVMFAAVRRNSVRLAFLGLAGGFLTPALNAGEPISLTVLLAYLAVLGTAMVWLGRTRWASLEVTAFAATWLYLYIEMPHVEFSGPYSLSHNQIVTLIFAAIFLLQYSFVPFIRARRFGTLKPYESAMVMLGAAFYYFVCYAQMAQAERHVLSLLTVILAAGYLALARMSTAQTRWMFAAMSLALVTIGVGITFSGSTMSLTWAIEGAVLLAVGLRKDSTVSRAFGYAAFLCALFALPHGLSDGGAAFLNHRFGTLAVFGLSLLTVAWAANGPSKHLLKAEEWTGPIAEVLGNVSLLVALGLDTSQAFHGSALGLSLLMLVYAAALVAAGFAMRRDLTRWEGLALFGGLIAKVFLIDLSSVDPIVRIVSFLAVGTVLLVIALAYQRRRNRPAESP